MFKIECQLSAKGKNDNLSGKRILNMTQTAILKSVLTCLVYNCDASILIKEN